MPTEEQKQVEEAKKPEPKGKEVQEAEALIQLKNANEELLKENEELKEAKKSFYDTILNKQPAEDPSEEAPKVDIEELRKKTFNPDQTNLEYWTNALALRDALIKEGKPDPFLPFGKNTPVTEVDISGANRVAEQMADMVKKADGSPEAFNALYQATVKDVNIPPYKRR